MFSYNDKLHYNPHQACLVIATSTLTMPHIPIGFHSMSHFRIRYKLPEHLLYIADPPFPPTHAHTQKYYILISPTNGAI